MSGYGIEQRKQRWRDFVDFTKPPQHLFHIGFDPDSPAQPLPWPTLKAERIEWAWQRYVRQRKAAEWLQDDRIPSLLVGTGTEIFAAAFGCPVQYPADTNPYARPLVFTAQEAAALKTPHVADTPLVMLFEMADELRRRAGPDAPFQIPDIQSPMDIAALIWNKTDFYLAMADERQAVADLAAKVAELLTEFMDLWFTRYGRDFIAHYPYYYMPQGLTLSEDEVGAVSAGTFEQWFLPELAALSRRYGGLGMHCCANAHHQWNGFLKIPGLRVLNLVQPAEQTKEAYRFFAPHVAQAHNWCGDGPPETWPARYPSGARVLMEPGASSRDEAMRLAEKLWAACGRA